MILTYLAGLRTDLSYKTNSGAGHFLHRVMRLPYHPNVRPLRCDTPRQERQSGQK